MFRNVEGISKGDKTHTITIKITSDMDTVIERLAEKYKSTKTKISQSLMVFAIKAVMQLESADNEE